MALVISCEVEVAQETFFFFLSSLILKFRYCLSDLLHLIKKNMQCFWTVIKESWKKIMFSTKKYWLKVHYIDDNYKKWIGEMLLKI